MLKLKRLTTIVCTVLLAELCWIASCESCLAQQKVPTPSYEPQRSIEKSIREVYSLTADATPEQKQEVLEKMIAAVNRDVGNQLFTDEVFAVVRVALSLAKELADYESFQTLLTVWEEHFHQGEDNLRSRETEDFIRHCESRKQLEAAINGIATTSLTFGQSLQFDTAVSIIERASSSAQKLKSLKSQKILNEAKDRLTRRKAAYDWHLLAVERLKTEPANPKANDKEAVWLGVYEQHWEQALPYLIKGSSVPWKQAAQAELLSKTLDQQLETASLWWHVWEPLADKGQDSDVKYSVAQHLVKLYGVIFEELPQGVSKDLVRVRTAKLQTSIQQYSAPFERSEVPSTSARPSGSNSLATDVPIDVLSTARLPEDALIGKWTQTGKVLTCEAHQNATLRFPIAVRGSYEIECTFVRLNGDDPISLVFPVGRTSCAVAVSSWHGEVHGLCLVDGKEPRDLGEGAAVRPGTLVNNQVYRLGLRVTDSGGQPVSILATLNGQPFVSWKGAYSRLSTGPYHNLNCLEAIGVVVNRSIVELHSLTLLVKPERTKPGKEPYNCAYELGEDWLSPIHDVADQPPPQILSSCKLWNGRQYFIPAMPMSFTEANLLAKSYNGRLLTISTEEENETILKEGKGLALWMAGHRRSQAGDWRDERNRLLTYFGKFGPWQPQNGPFETQLVIITGHGPDIGWHDSDTRLPDVYPCIEWGEEKPANGN